MLVLLAGKDNAVVPLTLEAVQRGSPLDAIAKDHRDLLLDLGLAPEALDDPLAADPPHWEGNVFTHTWWNTDPPFDSGSVTAFLFDPSRATTTHTCLVLGGSDESWVFACDILDESMWRLQAASMFRHALVLLDPQTYAVHAATENPISGPNPSDVLPPVEVTTGVERSELRAETVSQAVGPLVVYRVANTSITPELKGLHEGRVQRRFWGDYAAYALVMMFWLVLFWGGSLWQGLIESLFWVALVLTVVFVTLWRDPRCDDVLGQKTIQWSGRDRLMTLSLFAVIAAGIWGMEYLKRIYGVDIAQFSRNIVLSLVTLGALGSLVGRFRHKARCKVALEEVCLCPSEPTLSSLDSLVFQGTRTIS
ncbi:MAG: hypothetical protein COX57_12390 [Alphaproteobacteria bacterium CG_4_10_14_0_2_um_filter_63_37]|nr:MAG: hypothetical protein AUJ55_09880 [Proteobacteria bacterium CG1_02_64_396]PJA23768.1 MAG: hypothetical protein COX57_12390 [Alphaproteobacteria bacterium CG_4_10_14_0_2_um_filter_63_37]